MVDFSRYYQIKMYFEDEKYMAFRTLLGLYYYIVMPFGLKKCWCHLPMHHEHYLPRTSMQDHRVLWDDLAIKSKKKEEHFQEL